VALYTLYGIGAALGIVLIVRQFAREPPPTMTKAYQEQSTEYLKVCSFTFSSLHASSLLPSVRIFGKRLTFSHTHRVKTWNQLRGFLPRAIRARAWCRARSEGIRKGPRGGSGVFSLPRLASPRLASPRPSDLVHVVTLAISIFGRRRGVQCWVEGEQGG